jgi:hypothetical protein
MNQTDTPRRQTEINQEEWENQANWSGFGPYQAYFSKRDSRIFVPSRVWIPTWTAWKGPIKGPSTINFGHRWGFFALSLLFYAIIAIFGSIVWGFK